MLKPQDILVALKFLSPDRQARASYASLAESLGLSVSEAHAAVRRAIRSGLLIPSTPSAQSLLDIDPSTVALGEVLCYGLPYFLPAEVGRPALGIPTAESAPPLVGQLVASEVPPHVLAHPRGTARGIAIEPLYPSAAEAALRDPVLWEWLALADALRLTTGRVADLASTEVRRRLRTLPHAAAA